MQNYKAADGSLHVIDPEFAHLLPSGCVPITEAEFELLRPKPDPILIIEAEKRKVRVLREQVLDRLSGIAGRAVRKGDTALATVCDTASEALLNITKDLPSDPDAVEQVLLSRYLAIRGAAIEIAPTLVTAFAQMDA